MDSQAVALLNTLKRPAASSDAKLAALNALKSDIKHYRVPESAQANIFECLKLAITQQASSNLACSAFSALGHLIKRLKIQDESGNSIIQLAPRLFGALEERLGDMREPIRAAASQALTDLYPFCTSDVEGIIRDNAIGGSNPRAKQSGMQWVLRMHQEESMPFKSYVQAIVARLEDADGTVREAAKNVVIDLFKNAPDRAKTDLKRQLKAFAVRISIETQILAQIGSASASGSNSRPHTSHPEPDADMAASTRSLPAFDHAAHFNESINSEVAMPPPVETVQMDPLFVHSRSELEDIFRTMLPFFEGKETEHNWTPRDQSVTKLRRITKGNAPSEFHAIFMAGIKSLVEGILKVSNSLRTTMSTNGCHLVQELARTLGPALDPHVEMFLQAFIKMSAATKHIAAENGRQTSEAIFQNCSYHARMMQHIWHAAQEKNAQLRQCTPSWLNTVLRRQASYKSHFESSGGLELAEKCISKGLDDANPKVKEGMRATYWIFAKTWPERARIIMSKLDPKTKSALERDSNNPNAAILGHSTAAAAPPARAAGSASRSALREMMAEQRKAKAAGKLPDRPVSAMAQLSPAKPKPTTTASGRGASNLSHVSSAEPRAASSGATTSQDAATKKGSSLMSGPVRRPRRPEVPRPQTADPYASKRMLRPETPAEPNSTDNTPRGTGASKASYATSSVARNRARNAAARGSPSGSPARSTVSSSHGHPAASSSSSHLHPNSRPTSKSSNADMSGLREDDFTMVMPSSSQSHGDRRTGFVPGHKHPRLGQTASVDSGLPGMAEDDGFTMVIPDMQNGQPRARSPLAYRSPLKAMFEEARERIETLSPKLQGAMQNDHGPSLDDQLLLPRSVSPTKSLSAQEEVQVYEDPFETNGDGAPRSAERKVLGELPVNENVPIQSPALSSGSHGSPFASPQRSTEPRSPSMSSTQPDRADVLRNRRLLASGIDRIRAKTLDAHGFRRVQDLAKSDLDIWESGKTYDELMSVLLTYLQTFDQDPRLSSSSSIPSQKSTGLKAQALALVRALLTVHKKFAQPWHAKTLVTLLIARQAVDSTSLVAADLSKAADEIIRSSTASNSSSSPETAIDAIVDALPALPSRSTAMGLVVLRQLLSSAQTRKMALSATQRIKLVRTSAGFLDDADAEVRKADVELASELFELFGSSKQEFWAEFRGTDEGRLGLLTYYIARRGQAQALAQGQGQGQVVGAV